MNNAESIARGFARGDSQGFRRGVADSLKSDANYNRGWNDALAQRGTGGGRDPNALMRAEKEFGFLDEPTQGE